MTLRLFKRGGVVKVPFTMGKRGGRVIGPRDMNTETRNLIRFNGLSGE